MPEDVGFFFFFAWFDENIKVICPNKSYFHYGLHFAFFFP